MAGSVRIIIVALAFAAAATTVAVAAGPAAEGAAAMHFRLQRSAPEPGATVAAPAEVRLWFSDPPQDGTTSIRVIDVAGELAGGGAVTADAADPKAQVLALESPLPPGEYRVAWRAMAADGHVVRGEFTFTVTS